MEDSYNKLKTKNIDLESCSRRNNIRIVGLRELIEGTQPTAFFSGLLKEILGEEILPKAPELDRAHRALVAKPAPGSRGLREVERTVVADQNKTICREQQYM